jgi:DNA-binding CsgD family transcriptional regulator
MEATMIRSKRSEKRSSQRHKADFSETRVPNSAVRKTGIRVMGDLPWGAHVCLFYETKQDLLDTNVAYLKAGLENKEFCVWAISAPIDHEEAKNALRDGIPDFDRHLVAGSIELLTGYEWYLKGNEFDVQRITGGWNDKLGKAMSKGYEGLRISGNAFWMEANRWKEFSEYEQELDQILDDRQMIVLCTYALSASRAVDLLDVAHAHQFTIARRNGVWEFLESPELKQAKREIKRLSNALVILSKPFRGHQLLTPRERVVLAQILRGASSKEAARMLNISPRTVEFHRANVMQKLRAKNTADLVRIVLGE